MKKSEEIDGEKKKQQQQYSRTAHDVVNSLNGSDPNGVVSSLKKLLEKLEEDDSGTVAFRSALQKRDIVAVLLNCILGHANSLSMNPSKDIVGCGCQALQVFLRHSAKSTGFVLRECGTKPFLVLLRGLTSSTAYSIAICKILVRLGESDKQPGLAARQVGGMDAVLNAVVKNGRREDLVALGLKLLLLYCRGMGLNADALARNPQLADLFVVCRRFAQNKQLCLSALALFSYVTSRFDKQSIALQRAACVKLPLDALLNYSLDSQVASKAIHLLLRLSHEGAAQKHLADLKLFDQLYPLVSLYLGREELLEKLCLLIWRGYWIQLTEGNCRDMNQLVTVPIQSAEACADVVSFSGLEDVNLLRKTFVQERALPSCTVYREATLSRSTREPLWLASMGDKGEKNIALDTMLGIIDFLKQRPWNQPELIFQSEIQLLPPFSAKTEDDMPTKTTAACESSLRFESRFESGNLARAEKLGRNTYSLLLHSDTNSYGQVQWFYFAVFGMKKGEAYHFMIDNLEKPDSMYNGGMQPLIFCAKTAAQYGVGWTRTGSEICYMMNPFAKAASCDPMNKKTIPCYTASMVVRIPSTFADPDSEQPLYFAYCYPYTYGNLLSDLALLQKERHCVRQSLLCKTIGGNDCPLISITNYVHAMFAPPRKNDQVKPNRVTSFSNHKTSSPVEQGHDDTDEQSREEESASAQDENQEWLPLADRPHVFFCARVHPGETNASWIMRGLMLFLASADPVAQRLRDRVVFKIVPMLNPDGVIFGNHRCNLAGLDLNRQWTKPNQAKAPTVYHLRKLMLATAKEGGAGVRLFVDIHGHSRKPGIFLYGCEDVKRFGCPELVFPYLVDKASAKDVFQLEACNFRVLKSKTNCARVSVWRDLRLPNSFTLEASMSGNTTEHFNVKDLERMGEDLAKSVWDLVDPLQATVQEVRGKLEQLFPDRFLHSSAKTQQQMEQRQQPTLDAENEGSNVIEEHRQLKQKSKRRASSGTRRKDKTPTTTKGIKKTSTKTKTATTSSSASSSNKKSTPVVKKKPARVRVKRSALKGSAAVKSLNQEETV